MKGRPALRDAAFAVIALIVVLAIPLLHRSPAFEDFVIRLSAMALFATSLNLLVGNTGMVSFGHGMFYGLGAYAFALMMQMTELSLPVAAVPSNGMAEGSGTIREANAVCAISSSAPSCSECQEMPGRSSNGASAASCIDRLRSFGFALLPAQARPTCSVPGPPTNDALAAARRSADAAGS